MVCNLQQNPQKTFDGKPTLLRDGLMWLLLPPHPDGSDRHNEERWLLPEDSFLQTSTLDGFVLFCFDSSLCFFCFGWSD